MDIQKLIKELKTLEARATPRPWNITSRYPGNVMSGREITALPGFYPILTATTARGHRGIPEARLIAAVRNALPDLLDYISQLEAERDAAVEDLEIVCKTGGDACLVCTYNDHLNGCIGPHEKNGINHDCVKHQDWFWRNPARKE